MPGVFISSFLFCFWRQGLSLSLEHSSLAGLASCKNPPVSASLVRQLQASAAAPTFYVGLGIELRPLCLHGQHFTILRYLRGLPHHCSVCVCVGMIIGSRVLRSTLCP